MKRKKKDFEKKWYLKNNQKKTLRLKLPDDIPTKKRTTTNGDEWYMVWWRI